MLKWNKVIKNYTTWFYFENEEMLYRKSINFQTYRIKSSVTLNIKFRNALLQLSKTGFWGF